MAESYRPRFMCVSQHIFFVSLQNLCALFKLPGWLKILTWELVLPIGQRYTQSDWQIVSALSSQLSVHWIKKSGYAWLLAKLVSLAFERSLLDWQPNRLQKHKSMMWTLQMNYRSRFVLVFQVEKIYGANRRHSAVDLVRTPQMRKRAFILFYIWWSPNLKCETSNPTQIHQSSHQFSLSPLTMSGLWTFWSIMACRWVCPGWGQTSTLASLCSAWWKSLLGLWSWSSCPSVDGSLKAASWPLEAWHVCWCWLSRQVCTRLCIILISGKNLR